MWYYDAMFNSFQSSHRLLVLFLSSPRPLFRLSRLTPYTVMLTTYHPHPLQSTTVGSHYPYIQDPTPQTTFLNCFEKAFLTTPTPDIFLTYLAMYPLRCRPHPYSLAPPLLHAYGPFDSKCPHQVMEGRTERGGGEGEGEGDESRGEKAWKKEEQMTWQKTEKGQGQGKAI
eukprot:747747-Hanusia_phi.AAC.2